MTEFESDDSKGETPGGIVMQSYWIQSRADQTTLARREVPLPEPATGQVLVRMRAAGLNRGEFIADHGLTNPGAAKPAGGEGVYGIERAPGKDRGTDARRLIRFAKR